MKRVRRVVDMGFPYTGITKDLLQRLEDPELRMAYGAEGAKLQFALVLIQAREHVGWTQAALAKAAGVSQAYVAKLEQGKANPTAERMGSLLALMDLQLECKLVSLT